jgi:hypothetical protein
MKLTALQPIRHDGKRYAEGDVLDVSDKRQAEALIACGAAEAGGKAKAKAAEEPASEPAGDASQPAAQA